MRNLYEILSISPDSSINEIKTAYRRLAQKHHPDKGGDSDKFIEVKYAYDILRNTKSRELYDHEYAVYNAKIINEARAASQEENLESEWLKRTKFRYGVRKLRTTLDNIDSKLGQRYRNFIVGSPKDVRYFDVYSNILIEYLYQRFNHSNLISCYAIKMIDKGRFLELRELDDLIKKYNPSRYRDKLSKINKKYKLGMKEEKPALVKKPSKIKWFYISTLASYILYLISMPIYSSSLGLSFGPTILIHWVALSGALSVALIVNVLVLVFCNSSLEIEHSRFELKTFFYKAVIFGASQVSYILYQRLHFPVYIMLAKYILMIGLLYISLRFIRGMYYLLIKRYIL